MEKILAGILAAGIGFAVASLIVSNRLAARHTTQLAEQQALWQNEKAALEAALDEAKSRPSQIVTVPGAAAPAAPSVGATKVSPTEIVAKLRALKAGSGPQSRTMRQTIYWLEELIAAGPAALPAIREFLVRNEDIDYEAASLAGRGRGSVPNDFILPPSLRFGLFDVVKQIGGAEGEKLLAEMLNTTGRGVELVWLARSLQEIAPNGYRDAALAAALELLARAHVTNSASPLDRNDRDHLFSILTMFGDASYASTAQAQLLRPDGQVDRSALKYLQQSLGAQSVPLAAQMYDDPRLADPATKEPLARLALNFVGADVQANEFYQKAINDMTLTSGHRKNLIEDLNQDGFSDTKNLSARDLPLIQNRISLIEQLAPSATDPANAAAFKEAYKDLLNMRERVTTPPAPAVK